MLNKDHHFLPESSTVYTCLLLYPKWRNITVLTKVLAKVRNEPEGEAITTQLSVKFNRLWRSIVTSTKAPRGGVSACNKQVGFSLFGMIKMNFIHIHYQLFALLII